MDTIPVIDNAFWQPVSWSARDVLMSCHLASIMIDNTLLVVRDADTFQHTGICVTWVETALFFLTLSHKQGLSCAAPGRVHAWPSDAPVSKGSHRCFQLGRRQFAAP